MEREITALKAQKRNPNRINVYLDGEFAFGLSRIVAAWLHIGQRLSAEEISRLNAQDTFEVAYQRALNLLSYRPRAEAEVRQKLDEHGYDAAVTDAVIQRLKESGLLGDTQFAQTWVENRSTFRPRSQRMLAAELRQKGVEKDIIEQVLSESVDDNSLVYAAAAQYARRLDRVDWETFRKRLGAHLMRRGFTYGTILPILSQVWQEMHPQDGSDADQLEDG